jgi:PAS domain-containing protein
MLFGDGDSRIFRRLMDGAPIAAMVLLEGRVFYANAALATLLGYDDAAAIIGSEVSDLDNGADAIEITRRDGTGVVVRERRRTSR